MSQLSVEPGYLIQDGEVLTYAKLRAMAQPVVSLTTEFFNQRPGKIQCECAVNGGRCCNRVEIYYLAIDIFRDFIATATDGRSNDCSNW